jgi:prolyl oligopeptidase
MFITAKKGPKLDGQNPVLLYAYGGFNISMTPAFSVGTAVWLEMGGVYRSPILAGAGNTARNGTRLEPCYEKQNVFDDFIAGEWLIANKYTSPQSWRFEGAAMAGCWWGRA